MAILNPDPFLALKGVEPEFSNIAEPVEVDGLELIADYTHRGKPAKRRVMFTTSGGTWPIISSASVVILHGSGAALAGASAAVAAAATSASDFLTISFRQSFDSSSAAALSLVSSSAVATSASGFRRVSPRLCSFCSCVMVDGTCRVADKSG